MILTLLLVASIAGLALGGVYVFTKEPIAKAKRAKLNNALSQVLPEFDTTKTHQVTPADGQEPLTFYVAYKGDERVGTAVETYTNKGYSGKIEIMVGFSSDMTILNTAVLKHAETPGLGDKMTKAKSDWSNQFKGKNPENFQLSVTKDGGDVDAITAATISSRAFCDAVERAYKTYKKGGE
ncbi:MAG: RnfABCDGE type electron transport complex subunit G [Bacteroidales bacterium]|nr:RnfABCDGE type electron transport complex subunit G [Bacteroidales bacterium]